MLSSDHQGNQVHWAQRETGIQFKGREGLAATEMKRVLGKETC